MQAKVLVSLNPFPVPETVTLAPCPRRNVPAAKGQKPPSGPYAPSPPVYFPVPLADLDGETLHRLCEEFRDRVFSAAGKPQPPEAAPPVFDLSPVIEALAELRAVLCDPDGAVGVFESEGDNEVAAGALDKLARFLR